MTSPSLETRDLSVTRRLAALGAHASPAALELQQLPLAKDQQRVYNIPLVCSRSGITVGSFTTINIAGHMPLLGQWKDTQVLHPLFSLESVALLQFARNTYLRFCALTEEETVDSAVTLKQEQTLRVCALGMLHNLTTVRQDVPWMPDWKDVADNWTSLMTICYWRAYLDSDRFKFPPVRISKLEKGIDLRSYLQLCWDKKKEYEAGVATRQEEAQARIAERAMVNIRDAMVGMKPLSIKILWRWFELNISDRYAKDVATWMWELFTATDKTIREFTVRDIELFEEIFLSECPTGSSISHAFLEVLRGKHKLLTDHFKTYEILVPQVLQDELDSGELLASGPEPKLQDYASRTLWFIAKSKWQLMQPKMQKHREAEAQRQRETTVTPSFVPRLSYLDRVIEENDEVTDDEAGDDDGEY